jgi:hypothetical protein
MSKDHFLDECPWDLINCLLQVVKIEFAEFDEVMFQDVERPYELIFYMLSIE